MLTGLVEGVATHVRGIETRWSLRSLLTQTILWHYDIQNLTEHDKLLWVILLEQEAVLVNLHTASNLSHAVTLWREACIADTCTKKNRQNQNK